MNNEKTQQGNMQTGQQGKQWDKSQLDTILRQGKFQSQSQLTSYLQPHGLTGQINESDGSAVIYDDQRNKVANVQFTGTGSDQTISSITY